MHSEAIIFHSNGLRVTANWHKPDQAEDPLRSIVQGPGWMGLGDAAVYLNYHEDFTAAGFGVLSINYRGFGGSEGVPSIAGQVDDLRSAVSYLCSRDDVNSDAIGAFATGGTGGGNVVSLAARDQRIRAVACQFPVADGTRWLRGMRSDHEWYSLLHEIEADRQVRATTGSGEMVEPKEIMIPAPERAAEGFKADVATRIPMKIPLAIADELLSYSPATEAIGMKTPIMIIGVEEDAATPIEHARAIYNAVSGPRSLITQRNVGHYSAYAKFGKQITEQMIEFFQLHLWPLEDIVAEQMGQSQ